MRTLADQRTVLGHLETSLRYVAAATDTASEDDLRRAIGAALPKDEETSMATLAQQWLEQGRKKGWEEGREEGLA